MRIRYRKDDAGTPATGRSSKNALWRLGIAILMLAAILACPRISHGQVVPLEDVVPLEELDVRTDDLIRTATSYADAVREMKTAELSVHTLQVLRPNANVTNLEMQIANINLKTAEQKVKILRAIAENLLQTAQAKRDFLKRMEGSAPAAAPGATPAAQANPRLTRAEATVRILQMILEIH
jgi:hypothetical protein